MKKTLTKSILISCLAAALLTVAILSGVSFAAKNHLNEQINVPDYVRYMSQGYDFESYSRKRNILFCITDGDSPVRVHLFCIDEDKHTLDILDIPVSTYVTCDGFSGTVKEAFKTSVFTSIISRMLMLNTDAYAYISADGFVAACKMIGINADVNKLTDISAYTSGDPDGIKSHYQLLASFFSRLGELGAVEAATKLSGIMLNELDTNYNAAEMIELASIASSLRLENANIHILPGSDHTMDGTVVYAPAPEELATLLNDNFRVAGVSVAKEDLGVTNLNDKKLLFGDLPTKLTDY